MRRFGALLVVGALLALTGCGGSSDPVAAPTPSVTPTTAPTAAPTRAFDPNRPSAAAIAKSLLADEAKPTDNNGQAFTPDGAACVGRLLYDSAMSNQALKKFLQGGQTFSTADTNAFRDVLPQLAGCNPITLPGQTPTQTPTQTPSAG